MLLLLADSRAEIRASVMVRVVDASACGSGHRWRMLQCMGSGRSGVSSLSLSRATVGFRLI